MATATTMPGTMIGAIIADCSALRPGNRARSRPSAATTPRVVARAAARMPISVDDRNEAIHWLDVKSSWYQCVDQCLGGNANDSPAPRLIGMTTSVGASSRMATPTTHALRPTPRRRAAGLVTVHDLPQRRGRPRDPAYQQQHEERHHQQYGAQCSGAAEVEQFRYAGSDQLGDQRVLR